MDPKNLRGFGKEEVTVVTAYRVMCEHFRINVNTKSPCSQLKHFRVISKSSGMFLCDSSCTHNRN